MTPRYTIVAALLLVAIGLPALAKEQRAGESIVVQRVVIDAHILSASGEPLEGVTPADLDTAIDRTKEIAEVSWRDLGLYPSLAAALDENEAGDAATVEMGLRRRATRASSSRASCTLRSRGHRPAS